MTQQSQSFKAQFDKLEQIAEDLRNQQEVDIDRLIPMVDEATKAYEFCKTRLDEVEKALNERLNARAPQPSQSLPSSTQEDDDLPF
jgi:exodeoxyribonuclease VII small subunit